LNTAWISYVPRKARVLKLFSILQVLILQVIKLPELRFHIP
jgi:hypothetical protein